MIYKMSGLLSGDHDGVDHAIGNRLNKVIVSVNKGSKAMCNNFQPGPKVGIKVRLDCM